MRYRSPLLLGLIGLLAALVGVLAGLLATRRPVGALSTTVLPDIFALVILIAGLGLTAGAYGVLVFHTLRVAHQSPTPVQGALRSPLFEAFLASLPFLLVVGTLLYTLLSS